MAKRRRYDENWYKRLTKEYKLKIEEVSKQFGWIYGTPKQLKNRGWSKRAINKRLSKYHRILTGKEQSKELTNFASNYKEILKSLGGLTPEIDKLISVYTRRDKLNNLSKLYPGDSLHKYGVYYHEGKVHDVFKGSDIISVRLVELYKDIIKAYDIKEEDIEKKMGIDPSILK